MASNVIDLLVFTFFGSDAATEITLPKLKQTFHFCSAIENVIESYVQLLIEIVFFPLKQSKHR